MSVQPLPPLPPHLVKKDDKKICSACSQVIEPKDGSLSKAFRIHYEERHRPKTETFSKTK